ncbi:tRNA-dihydrouridine(47) synthase [NADP(+)]-like [Anaeramoeba flamelloides]|uniref:tRNA-dihydrouridine(47) synthase [NAD(P)(+)] n=1 Tax=Anaeramoeba flamelloides TaxID=1746091 RepID=A0AAV7YBF3_9EUKA|nr:tRNA-dihydrouridine(47) synthase [NADP(+)]-like [Anaeramoeba flamelloides]
MGDKLSKPSQQQSNSSTKKQINKRKRKHKEISSKKKFVNRNQKAKQKKNELNKNEKEKKEKEKEKKKEIVKKQATKTVNKKVTTNEDPKHQQKNKNIKPKQKDIRQKKKKARSKRQQQRKFIMDNRKEYYEQQKQLKRTRSETTTTNSTNNNNNNNTSNEQGNDQNNNNKNKSNTKPKEQGGYKGIPKDEGNILDFTLIRKLRKKQIDFQNTEYVISRLNSTFSGVISATKRNQSQIPIKREDKRKIDLKGKLILAPLTTLGNLPFRRLCVGEGAEVTVSEMVLGNKILLGKGAEFSLVRRHESEKYFGVQIAASSHWIASKTTELLTNEFCCGEKGGIDFFDLNSSCPIDFAVKKKMGAYLLEEPKRLSSLVKSMSLVTHLPVTLKIRTGFRKNKIVANKIAALGQDSGASAIFIHGRTQQQRYSLHADWNVIYDVAKSVSVPVIGSGDVFSQTEYWNHFDQCDNLGGIAIGRGALIKPWIFREIKERQVLDPSASERLDLMKKYVKYGLEHWGSDQRGISRTRRFLLEWLSFTWRYVPTGCLERAQVLVGNIPQFVPRNDLEALLSSNRTEDWLKISSLLLGETESEFKFTPTHISRSWRK